MGARILIVDDEADNREMLCRHFEFEGYEVDSAANGEEALEQMRSARIEVVISDFIMPVMDGIDLLRAIRRQYPMTHVIMMTGYATLDNALSCMRHGADTCVFKPLTDLAELEAAVERAIADLRRWQEKFRTLRGLTIRQG